MKKKIIGLFLASLMILSMTGVAYAYWTATFRLDAVVETGSFWGYLTIGDYWDNDDGVVVNGQSKDECDVYAWLDDYQPEALDYDNPGPNWPKALHIEIKGPWETDPTGGPDYIDPEAGAYPGYEAYVQWDMHWYGSVPAHVIINPEDATVPPQGAYPPSGAYPDLPDWLVLEVWVDSSTHPEITPGLYTLDDFLTIIDESQWHYCDQIWVTFVFKVIEIDDPNDPDYPIEPPQDWLEEFDICFYFYQYNLDPFDAAKIRGGS